MYTSVAKDYQFTEQSQGLNFWSRLGNFLEILECVELKL